MWQTLDKGKWSKELLEAALTRVPAHVAGDYRAPMTKDKEAGVFRIEYRDGLKAAVEMNGWIYEGDGGRSRSSAGARSHSRRTNCARLLGGHGGLVFDQLPEFSCWSGQRIENFIPCPQPNSGRRRCRVIAFAVRTC
jgi:hypothetical protein